MRAGRKDWNTLPGGGWHVGLDDGSEHEHAALVIANGHH
jgi:hypothetical protein